MVRGLDDLPTHPPHADPKPPHVGAPHPPLENIAVKRPRRVRPPTDPQPWSLPVEVGPDGQFVPDQPRHGRGSTKPKRTPTDAHVRTNSVMVSQSIYRAPSHHTTL